MEPSFPPPSRPATHTSAPYRVAAERAAPRSIRLLVSRPDVADAWPRELSQNSPRPRRRRGPVRFVVDFIAGHAVGAALALAIVLAGLAGASLWRLLDGLNGGHCMCSFADSGTSAPAKTHPARGLRAALDW